MLPQQGWAPPAWLVILIAALIALAPLLVHGCSCGHDFDFHLVSWMEAANQLLHGNLHPQWAASPAYNAGEPRFVFYPPLSWYLGAGFGLLLTHLPGISETAAWNATPMLYTFAALALAGWTMYRLAREFASAPAAVFAAAVYLANPYMLFTAFERTAYAELLAAAWIPLLLQGILRENVTLPRTAVPLALLWLTNAPAAVIGSYTLALLAGVRIARGIVTRDFRGRQLAHVRASLRLAILTFAGTGLGLMVAAFYIIPAAYERRYVQIEMALVPSLRIQDNFLFHHTVGPDAALHDQVLHTASLIALSLWLFGLLTLILCWYASRRSPRRARMIPLPELVILSLSVGFALTPWSRIFWQHAPEAAFLQFPWRATSVLAVIAALGCAAALPERASAGFKWQLPILACVIAIPLAWPAYRLFHQACDPADTPDARLAVFHSSRGSDPTDEYTPGDADNDVLQHNDPPWWLSTNAKGLPPPKTTLLPGPTPEHIELRSPRAADLILNLRAYPAWQILLDRAPDLQRIHRDDGLLALPIPAGASTIDIQWVRLPDQKIGDLVTLLGLGLLTASMLPARWRVRKPWPRLTPAPPPGVQK